MGTQVIRMAQRDKGKMVAGDSQRPCSGAKGIQEGKASCLDPNAKARPKTKTGKRSLPHWAVFCIGAGGRAWDLVHAR